MSKFLLLLCFITVHVLGEGVENIPAIKSDILSSINEESYKMLSTENSEATSLFDKISTSAKSLLPSLNAGGTSTKLTESTTTTEGSISTTVYTTVKSKNTKISSTATTPKTPIADTTPKTPVTDTTTLSTTTAPVTTVPPPTPGKWIVNETDKICIVVQMSVQFSVSYVNTSQMISNKVFDMPVDIATTKANGTCGSLEQKLILNWTSSNFIGNMTLHFIKNETESRYSLHHLEVVLPASNFPNANLSGPMILMHQEPAFIVGLSNSYRCMKQQVLELKQNDTQQTASNITISSLQFQAFKSDDSTVFGLAKDCAFGTPDVVPIAVGCALAGLVIVVLIAYLIGRRRTQARGYLSM